MFSFLGYSFAESVSNTMEDSFFEDDQSMAFGPPPANRLLYMPAIQEQGNRILPIIPSQANLDEQCSSVGSTAEASNGGEEVWFAYHAVY